MPKRDLQPAALAIVRIALRICGWEPIIETAKDITTIVQALVPSSKSPPPSSTEIDSAVDWARESLNSLLEHEYEGVPANDFNAAVLAVADLLARQEINYVIIQAVTDSSTLESYLLARGGYAARRDLGSEGSQAAFDAVLHLSCRHLAEIGLSSPDFGPIALQQLLRSQQRLTEIANELLKTVQLSPAEHDDAAFSVFTSRYLTRLAEQLDYLDLPGLDLDRYRRRYNLTAAYVPITVFGGSVRSTQFTSVRQLMELPNFLLVAGGPGSGKSTLLKWIAVQLSRAAIQEPSRHPVPILVKLRTIRDIPDLESIAGSAAQGLVVKQPDDWSRDIVESGNCVLLIDGLDEVPEQLRETIARWINNIYEDHGRRGLRIIVTSRPAAVVERRFRPAQAAYAALQPMPQGSIERFVSVWHQTIFNDPATDDPNQWIDSSDRLLARLEHDTQLARLASTPLLCAVICALYYARNEHLPSERSELYNALLSMLLARRDAERSGLEQIYSLSDLERLVQDIANEYLLRSEEELSRSKVLAVMRKSLRGFRNRRIRNERPGLLLDHIVNRTGILRELPPDSRIDFWHKSFQEYFAAKSIVERGDDHLLLKYCAQPTWYEVAIWASSFMPMRRASSLIVGILDRADASNGGDQNYLRRLGLSCAHYTLQLTDQADERVRSAAASFISPSNTAVTPSDFVSIGDPAIPFLSDLLRGPDRELQELAIAALGRIGGDAANTTLAAMPTELKESYARLLADGWRHAGSEDYARRVLGQIPGDRVNHIELQITSYRQLRGLRHISPIYKVYVDLTSDSFDAQEIGTSLSRSIWRATLHGFEWRQVLAFLNRYPTVRELVLVNPIGIKESLPSDGNEFAEDPSTLPWTGEKARSGQPSYASVRSLVVNSTSEIQIDLSWLWTFPDLETLDILGAQMSDVYGTGFRSSIKDVSIVSMFDEYLSALETSWKGQIERLTVSPWPFTSLSPLGQLSRLQELRVLESPELESLQGVQDLKEIVTLDLSYCENLWDVDEALALPELGLLVVVGCEGIMLADLLRLHGFTVEADDEGLGWLDGESATPDLIADRWNGPLYELSDTELQVRGWDDWSFWDEIRGDADEWETVDPENREEQAAASRGLTLYSSLDAWHEGQAKLAEESEKPNTGRVADHVTSDEDEGQDEDEDERDAWTAAPGY